MRVKTRYHKWSSENFPTLDENDVAMFREGGRLAAASDSLAAIVGIIVTQTCACSLKMPLNVPGILVPFQLLLRPRLVIPNVVIKGIYLHKFSCSFFTVST